MYVHLSTVYIEVCFPVAVITMSNLAQLDILFKRDLWYDDIHMFHDPVTDVCASVNSLH